MRPSTAILLGLAVVIQYPLWLGKGGWLKVWDSDRQLRQQRETNRQLELRNAGLEAETRNLKAGLDAVEERARFELGMIKADEVFYQLPKRSAATPTESKESP
jgi:cell division protein FtsB